MAGITGPRPRVGDQGGDPDGHSESMAADQPGPDGRRGERGVGRLAELGRICCTGGTSPSSHPPPRPVVAAGDGAAPELIPFDLGSFDRAGLLRTPWAVRHIQWMLQKDRLDQDMFLIGATGPMRRWLALRFCEVLKREVEVQSLTRDTTEADLKQRREIGAGGTIRHVNQAVVNAAIHGRVLVLEGLEKVERNVLPVLNNLLENREMQLEDGRFLVAPRRFDQLLTSNTREHLTETMRLVRVHESFRVIALGVPVPPFPGNPLDPPLRSRFQARHIDRVPSAVLAGCIARLPLPLDVSTPNPASIAIQRELVTFYETIWQVGLQMAKVAGLEAQTAAFTHMLYPSENAIVSCATLTHLNPSISSADLISRVYPARFAIQDEDTLAMLDVVLPPPAAADLTASDTAVLSTVITRMTASHSAARDLCLIGHRGEGKSFTAQRFAATLGYVPVETLHLYKDMTARDLLLRRTTTSSGETVWQKTPLLVGMQLGRLVILDGIDRLAMGTIAVLLRLIEDREATLFDGTRYMPADKFSALQSKLHLTPEEMVDRELFAIHPRFRILALAAPPARNSPWLTNEVMHLFHFFTIGTNGSSNAHYGEILRAVVPRAPADLVAALCGLATELTVLSDDKMNEITSRLSLRQMLRICRRAVTHPEETSTVIQTAMLTSFLPTAEKLVVRELMEKHGFEVSDFIKPDMPGTAIVKGFELDSHGRRLFRVGETRAPVATPENEALVPDVVFFDMPKHLVILEAMLKDLLLGEHLCLIGNQGVGKNKLCDHLLQMLGREREYVQLHRDTTVQALTLLPSLRDGVVVYEDSPLVKAMEAGRVLMIDEFDKAPTEVVCILKGLLEDGEVLLSDGRRFISSKSPLFEHYEANEATAGIARIHNDFRVIALANRPGYPFLGNDFFREMGDVFACHVVENPDLQSEITLLQGYGPDVPVELIERLSRAFAELRGLMDEGVIAYPYSTRELVNVVVHVQRYPNDSITTVLENLFAFDAFDPELRTQLYEVFTKYGIPLGSHGDGGGAMDMYQLAQSHLVAAPVHLFDVRSGEGGGSIPIRMKQIVRAASVSGAMAAIWKPIGDVQSARAKRFSEEMLSLEVVHYGDVTGVASVGHSVFGLTDTMELHEYDVQRFLHRTHSLVELAGFKYSWGGPLINPLVSLGPMAAVCTYDILNRVLILVRASQDDGITVETFPIDLHPENLISPRPVGMLQLRDETTLVLYAINGHHLVLVACRTGLTASVGLPDSIQVKTVESFGDAALLVTFQRKGKLGDGHQQLVCHLVPPTRASCEAGIAVDQLSHAVLRDVSFVPTDAAHTYPDFALDYLSPTVDGAMVSAANLQAGSGATASMCTSPAVLAAYALFPPRAGSSPSASSCSIFGHIRLGDAKSDLTMNGPATTPFMFKKRVALWMKRSRLLVTAISSPAGVIVEVFNPASLTLKVIPLAKRVTDATAFLPNEEQRSDLIFLRNNGMPHARGLAEMDDGRLSVLLANKEIRILEVRDEQLELESALWDRLIGNEETGDGDGSGDGQGDGSGDGDGDGDGDGNGRGSGSGAGEGGSGEGSGGGRGKGGGGKRGGGSKGGGGGRSGEFEFHEELLHFDGDAQVSDRDAVDPATVPYDAELVREALETAKAALSVQQKTFELTDVDEGQYAEVYGSVQQEVLQLRVVLEGLESKEKERVWLKNQVHGDLDDNRLVDGATGDKNVYKKRGADDFMFGTVQRLPKRLLFVMDVSSSMSVMNGDGRLDRLVATAVLIMEAFSQMEHKFHYAIVGHSGDSDGFPFVNMGHPPKNRAERLEVLRKMYSHATYCGSGDNTLPAAARAVRAVVDAPADDYFVFLISDANLASYGISPKALAEVLLSDDRVNSYAVFIANKAEADGMKKMMPSGRAHTVLDMREMPRLFRQIFASAVIR